MQETIRAVVSDGKLRLLESLSIPDGTEVLVTVVSNGDQFWLNASASSSEAIWDNPEDDIYGELLKR